MVHAGKRRTVSLLISCVAPSPGRLNVLFSRSSVFGASFTIRIQLRSASAPDSRYSSPPRRVTTILRSRNHSPGTYSASLSTTLTDLDVSCKEGGLERQVSNSPYTQLVFVPKCTYAVDGGRCRGVMQPRSRVSADPGLAQNGDYIRSIGRCCHGCLCEATKVFSPRTITFIVRKEIEYHIWEPFHVNIATGRKSAPVPYPPAVLLVDCRLDTNEVHSACDSI